MSIVTKDRSFDLSRRGLLAGAAALSATALTGCGRSKTAAHTATPFGIQLYTVRAEMEQDFAGTLKRIADIGYKEVEFHNYFGTPPGEVRAMLADLGLTAPSAHMNARALREDPEPLLAAAKEAGHEFALIAWLHPDDRQTLDQYREWADLCNQLGEKCSDMGMRFGYHNHDFEFQAIDGVDPYDILMERTEPSLVEFELDFFWVEKAGKRITDVLATAPDRFPLCHIKDMDKNGDMADIGAGVIDFTDILTQRSLAKFEHYYIERDDATEPLQSAAISHAAFASILDKVAAAN